MYMCMYYLLIGGEERSFGGEGEKGSKYTNTCSNSPSVPLFLFAVSLFSFLCCLSLSPLSSLLENDGSSRGFGNRRGGSEECI